MQDTYEKIERILSQIEKDVVDNCYVNPVKYIEISKKIELSTKSEVGDLISKKLAHREPTCP